MAILSFCFNQALAAPTNNLKAARLQDKPVDIGKQIYLSGLLPSGEAIQAIAAGDSPVSGDQFTCVSCHRRSRLGASEGGKQVPPLTATALFKPAQLSATRGVLPKAFKHVGSLRIPYTDETLAKAIKAGVDPSGRKLSPLMPRYELDDEAMAALTAYLKTEPATTPGVDDTTLHFATVITEGVDPQKSKAMLAILNGFFQDKNANTRHNTKRAKFSAYKMYQVYRKWKLHVWELTGDSSSWPAQLEKYYKAQPVLAMIGGLSTASWQPMHQFCEQFEVACLFPNTNSPVIADNNNFYTIYFSKGVTLDAETLAHQLLKAANNGNKQVVTQIFRENEHGAIAAQALREIFKKQTAIHLQDILISKSDTISPAYWGDLFKKSPSGVVALWLGRKDLETLGQVQELPSTITAIYGSVNLAGEPLPLLSDAIKEKLLLIYPWELPDARTARLMRVKSWLKSKKIAFDDEQLQANTFFSVQVLGEIIMHLLDNFSSTYIMERLEGMLAALSSGSIYPHLSLGTGQRYASKGNYIVKIAKDGQLTPVEGWIVP
jgi:cytochrome c553